MEITGRIKQIIDERIKKIDSLRKEGINPYSHKFEGDRDHSLDIKNEYSSLREEEYGGEVRVAGRVMTKRGMGKISFIGLQDLRGNIQVVFQKGVTPEDALSLFKKVDTGDIIGLSGKVFKTRRGEISVMAENLAILTKAILPLPDKFHGIKDEDERLRKRYLDIIMNEDVKDIFVKKRMYHKAMRDFLERKGFLEVETPVLENSAGGAAATPFATHHNALDLDVYLRISVGELWQKKLLVAGYEKTFEIGRIFRNEGMDAEHLQDYTSMEFYWGYADYRMGMELVEEMYKEVANSVLEKLDFEVNGHHVDLGIEWKEYDYEKTIEEKTGINIYSTSKEDIMKFLDSKKIDYDEAVDKWRMVDLLWKFCRRQITGPGFLTGQPVEIAPLAKRKEEDSRKVEQFQVIMAGSEVGNGYSELNDPIDQEERFKKQRELKEGGDSEAMDHDKGFVEALRYGMPPACGFGVSERFFGFLMGRPLRECVAFPLMRPEFEVEKNEKDSNKS